MQRLTPRRITLALVVITGVLLASLTTDAGYAAPSEPAATLGSPVAERLVGPAPHRSRSGGRLANELAPGHTTYKTAKVDRDASGRVHVLVDGDDTAATTRAVEAAGGTVNGSVPGKVDALVPGDRLEALSESPGVTFVENGRQYQPTAGTITSEGRAKTGANKWQTAIPSYLGAGVNVAVVDVGGFQGYDTELGDELPAVVSKKNYCGSNPDVFDASFVENPHGTEIAAIVHDMAPASGIVLLCAMNDVQIAQAKNYILGRNRDGDSTNNIAVAVGAFGNPVAARGDGNGPPGTVEASIRELRQNNVLWVSSAGNEADVHNLFAPAGPDLNTNIGPIVQWAPNNYEDGLFVAAGQQAVVFAKWDAWGGTRADFDLYLATGDGVIVGGSEEDQTAGAPPVEAVGVTNNTGSGQFLYAILIRFQSPINPRFDTFVFANDSELRNPAGSVTVPASSPFAFAAGAGCVAKNQKLEFFSAQGPNINGLMKPDITAPDGTSGQVTGSIEPYGPANSQCTSGFTGTSAAAAHTAGAAALAKSASPSSNADALQQFLTCRAPDAGPAGPDNQYGAGTLAMGTTPEQTPANLIKPAVIRGTTIFERNSLCSGPADVTFTYGSPGDTIIMCDWDGNGTRTPAAFRNGTFLVRNGSGPGFSDVPAFRLGDPGDIPVCGHWKGAGKTETAGVFRRGTFFLKYQNSTGFADTSFLYGNASDVPLSGDWNGDGITTVGVYRSGTWYLRNANGGGFADLPPVNYGGGLDLPVVGDWDGNGTVTLGVVRAGAWLLKDDNFGGFSNRPSFLFGEGGDKPQTWR